MSHVVAGPFLRIRFKTLMSCSVLQLSEHPLLNADEERMLSGMVRKQIMYEEKKAELEMELSREITEAEWAAACGCDRLELSNALAVGLSTWRPHSLHVHGRYVRSVDVSRTQLFTCIQSVHIPGMQSVVDFSDELAALFRACGHACACNC